MNTKNLKPFDLEAALRGEPVMLRSGQKAFVRHHETKTSILGNFNLVGIKEGNSYCLTWTKDGGYDIGGDICDFDIIGMYPKTRTVNGFEVPAPETVEPERYTPCYIAATTAEYFYFVITWLDDDMEKAYLERGLVFLNKEDAAANTKAMLGINPYEEE